MRQHIMHPCASAAAMAGGALRRPWGSSAAVTNWPSTMQTRTRHIVHTLAETSRADDSGAAHQDTRQPDSGAASPEPIAAQAADWIEVGLIRSVHGLRGEVKVEPLTDSPADRLGTAGARHVAVSTMRMPQYCSLCFLVNTVVLPGMGEQPLTTAAPLSRWLQQPEAPGRRRQQLPPPTPVAIETGRSIVSKVPAGPASLAT